MSIRASKLGSTVIINSSLAVPQLKDWVSTVVLPGLNLTLSVTESFSFSVAPEIAPIMEEIKLRRGRLRRGNERR